MLDLTRRESWVKQQHERDVHKSRDNQYRISHRKRNCAAGFIHDWLVYSWRDDPFQPGYYRYIGAFDTGERARQAAHRDAMRHAGT